MPAATAHPESDAPTLVDPIFSQASIAVRVGKESKDGPQNAAISSDPPLTVPQSGRKRAFSDPGDVKRPSTAGTDKLPRFPVPVSQTMVHQPSAAAEIPIAVEKARMPYAGGITPLYLPASIVSPPAVQTQAPPARDMPYQGFEYVPYADVSLL